MKLYILFDKPYCEPKFFLGAFTTPEKAEAAKAVLEDEALNFGFIPNIVIEEYEAD